MTGPQPDTESAETRPISVAELLARNGTIGAPAVTRRRRRRRGDSESVTVAELTGEIPVIRDDHFERDEAHTDEHTEQPPPAPPANGANGGGQVADLAREHDTEEAEDAQDAQDQAKSVYWSEPEPRWPKSPPRTARPSGPERSEYPRPLRQPDQSAGEQRVDQRSRPESQSGAEGMSPDPVDHYTDIPVDVMDSEVRDAEPAVEDSAYVRSYLQASEGTLFGGGQTLADEMARRRSDERTNKDSAAPDEELDEIPADFKAIFADEAREARRSPGRFGAVWRGSLIVFQSILAVAFGAGLFVAFDQLWRWNSIVALVLSVLVILGLVVGVRVVRKTEDIASTLIAVAVGALITLGPLALSLQSG
jgi:hypothetical protein